MAAEIVRAGRILPHQSAASMRPRRMAAEIPRPIANADQKPRSFNEAAANGRGNRRPRRPRPTSPPCSFNEAAANGRGNRMLAYRSAGSRALLQ